MAKNNHKRREHGLTLIELMIAVSVALVGLVLLAGSFTPIRGTIKTTADAGEAVYHALTVMEEVRTLSRSDLETYVSPLLDGLGTDELIDVLVVSNTGNEVLLPTNLSAIPGGIPNPVEVRVRVRWTDDAGRPKTTTLGVKKFM